MSPQRSTLPPADSELARLIECACDGTITPAECGRLETLLVHDRAGQRYYVAYMDLHVQARWLQRGRTGAGSMGDDAAEDLSEPSAAGPPVAGPPATAPGPWFWGLPSWGTVTISYVLAALVLCGGIVVARSWKSSHGSVGRPARPATIEVVKTVRPPVGKITAMYDCRWNNPVIYKRTNLADVLTVAVGSKYVVTSGWMEITYTSGAKVILEGPVEYEVDDPNGGFLRHGRATFLCKSGPASSGRANSAPANSRATNSRATNSRATNSRATNSRATNSGRAQSGAAAIAQGAPKDRRVSPAGPGVFRVHIPPPGRSHSYLVALQDVDIVLMVNKEGFFSRALSPAQLSLSPAVPLKKVVLPDYPSVAVHLGPDNTPYIVKIGDGEPATALKPVPAAATAAAASGEEKNKTNSENIERPQNKAPDS